MIRGWRSRRAVEPEIFARHPDYVAAIVVAEEHRQRPERRRERRWLAAAERHVRARGLERAADAPEIAAWRAAFSAFGAKPKQYPCSAEALAARVLKGGELPRVNRLVDLYNAVSVRHLVPVGGEDLDRLPARCGSWSPPATSASTRPAASSTAAGGDRLARRCRRDLPALELAPGHADAPDRGDDARVLRLRPPRRPRTGRARGGGRRARRTGSARRAHPRITLAAGGEPEPDRRRRGR